jgi:hypothetical protein
MLAASPPENSPAIKPVRRGLIGAISFKAQKIRIKMGVDKNAIKREQTCQELPLIVSSVVEDEGLIKVQ